MFAASLTLAVRAQPPARVATSSAATELSSGDQTQLVAQYCATCHNDRAKAGGLTLAGWTPAHADETPEIAEKMIRKLRAGMMPPQGAKRPDAPTLGRFVTALETRMDARLAHPDPGWRPFQRLNRAEYAAAVRDLLAIDVDVNAFLPPDTVSAGYDNIADVQTFSPALMDGYLRAASRVAALAIGDPTSTPTQATFKLPKTASQLERAEGAPLGTRGGISVEHTFPADGDYVFSLDFFAEPLGFLFGNTATGEQIEVSVDGARVALFDIDPKMSEEKTGLTLKTIPTRVTAGTHRVTAAFLRRFEGLVNDLIAPIDHTLADTEIGIAYGITTLPHLRSLSIVGPHRVTGVSETPGRRKVFSCRPLSADEEASCAAVIVRRLATHAFRRPVTEKEQTRLMSFYARGRSERDFEHGITKALEAILASPQFLLRIEPIPAHATGSTFRLGEYELASRLSFFLWSGPPDEELLGLAAAGKLALPVTLGGQVRRMIADARSSALATRFASQWLRLQELDRVTPDPIRFPYSDQSLTLAFKRETELFFDSLVREDRSVLELLTADYTFVNERIARHYGIANVTGLEFRRVSLPAHRRGILGHGSILTLTSIADRTSPVMRGKWVMEVLLGTAPPPPPPNVPPFEETASVAEGRILTVRERMEEHRRNPACTSCHRVIDPLGLALENFDATGKWRSKDGGAEVDASGQLFDGSTINGTADLRSALLRHKDALLLSFTENLMTYALGRRLEAADMPTVRRIIRDAAKQNYRMSAFLNGVVDSAAFSMSRRQPAVGTLTAPVAQEPEAPNARSRKR
jgi:mono/diheme cytochrome c family protein